MELRQVETLTKQLMDQHGLVGWSFEWDSSRRRFGCCAHSTRTISLSRHLVLVNNEARVRNTVLHEIAHALLPSHEHHGPNWVRKAREIGCDGKRCYTSENTVTVWMPYTGTCPKCSKTVGRTRLPKRINNIACTPCCRAYNRGRFDTRFVFTWSATPRIGWQPTPVPNPMAPVVTGEPITVTAVTAPAPTRYALWKARKLARLAAERPV